MPKTTKLALLMFLMTGVFTFSTMTANAATTPKPAQVIVTFNDGTLSKATSCTTDLSSKLSVADDSFAVVPNTVATWSSGVATIQFQDGKSNQIQPWKGSYYLAIAGTNYTELIPFSISSPTANVKLTVSYIPDYANIAAFTGDTKVTATNISVVSGLAPKKTPVMLRDSKGNIYLETSDANTGVYNFFVPTGTYGIGLVGRKDTSQGADTSVFGSASGTAISINYAGSGNTETWYTIKTAAGQVTGPLVNSLSPATGVTAAVTTDSTVSKNASAPKITGKVEGASNVSTIGFNYVTGTGTADPVIVSGKITVSKTGDQAFSLTLPTPFNGSKMELVYSNTPNNATFNTNDFDFSATKIAMSVTAPTAATTYDKDIKLTIAITSADSATKAFIAKALTNVPDYLLYSTTTTFIDAPTSSVATDVSNKDKGVIAISTDSKAATGVAYYSNGSLTIKGGTLPKVATAGYYFKVVSGKCWSGDTAGTAAYTVTAPIAAATLKASASKTGASDSTHTTLTITNADTTNNNYYYEFTSTQVKSLTVFEDFTQANWTKIASLSNNTAQIDGTDHTTDYLTVACSPKSGNPTYVSIKLSASSFPTASTTSSSSFVSASPGSVPGSTKLTGTLASGHSMSYLVSATPVTTVAAGTDIRTTQYRLYTSGSDITDVAAGKYIAVIEADSTLKVVKFKCLTLTASNVNPEAVNSDGVPAGYETFALDLSNCKVKGVPVASLGTPAKTAANAVVGSVTISYAGSIDDKGTNYPTIFTLKTPGLGVLPSISNKQGDNDPNDNTLSSGSIIIIQILDESTHDPSTGDYKSLYYKINVNVTLPPGDPDATPGAVTTVIYSGKITDMNAVSGMSLTLKSNNVTCATTMTEADGMYYFLLKDNDCNKKYTMSVGGGSTGYMPLEVTLDTNSTGHGYTNNINLYGKNGYSVSGKITDSNGSPVANAIVTLFDSTGEHWASSTGQVSTDQNGNYTLWFLGTNGTVKIGVQKTSADSYHISDTPFTIDNANVTGQDYKFSPSGQ